MKMSRCWNNSMLGENKVNPFFSVKLFLKVFLPWRICQHMGNIVMDLLMDLVWKCARRIQHVDWSSFWGWKKWQKQVPYGVPGV